MDEKNIAWMNDLLWKFRHCFFNVLTPSQFHEGIRCKPCKINRLPGVTPRKEKMRQISDQKLSYLRKHITELCDQGVLEELMDASDCFASPVHIVLEKRFVASKNRVVKKSRFTADMRSINAALPTSSFPIPNCDSFRRQ